MMYYYHKETPGLYYNLHHSLTAQTQRFLLQVLRSKEKKLLAIRKLLMFIKSYKRRRDQHFEQSKDAREACVVVSAVKNPSQASD